MKKYCINVTKVLASTKDKEYLNTYNSNSPPDPPVMIAEQSTLPLFSDPCVEELIQFPGSIQPYGLLFVLQEPHLKLLQVSENVRQILGVLPSEILGKTLYTLLTPEQHQTLANDLLCKDLYTISLTQLTLLIKGKKHTFNAHFQRWDQVLILELELLSTAEPPGSGRVHSLIKTLVHQFQGISELKELCNLATTELRNLTGFDRVMIYRFDEAWHGEVVGEARTCTMDSLLGLHFPATDIPPLARELFALNEVRLIETINYTPALLVPQHNPLTDRPLDLSKSLLRGVSRIHLEYLHNMGVTASMTLALMHNQKLWGLIAFHHQTPKRVNYELRMACHLIAQFLAVELTARENDQHYAYQISLKQTHMVFVEQFLQAPNLRAGLQAYGSNLLVPMNASGMAFYHQGVCTSVGITPSDEEVAHLVQWLQSQTVGELFYTDSLSQTYPRAEEIQDRVSGLLAVKFSSEPEAYLLWFRPEVLQTVHWGGNPNQRIELREGSSQLHPCQSFELWKQIVRHKSCAWSSLELDTALSIKNALLSIALQQADTQAQIQRLELENARQQMNQLQQLHQLKDDFLSTVSHELRTPISNMKISIHLLKRAKTEEKRTNYLAMLETECLREISLINDLLDLQSLEVNKKTLHLEAMSMALWLPSIVESFYPRAQEHQQKIEIVMDPNLNNFTTDFHILERILAELLNNACKYTPPQGEIKIEIQLTPMGLGLYVMNTCPDIPEIELQRIFEKFYRIPQADRWRRGGTGLGLSLVKSLVEVLQGQIQVTSSHGWTVFELNLPYCFSLPD